MSSLHSPKSQRCVTLFRCGTLLVAALPISGLWGASAGDARFETFKREIQPILEQHCYDCHGDGAEKGGVTLDGFTGPADLHDHKLWLRALKNVRAGIMPPSDAEPLSSTELQKLTEWIKWQGLELDPAKPDPGRVTVRRLNRVEYRNTIRDLLGVDFDTAKEFPADDTGHGFDNIADVLTISPMLLEKYFDAAQAVVAKGVVTKPKMMVEKLVLGRQFATVKVDTTLPAPTTPSVDSAAVTIPAPAVPPVAPAPGPVVAPGQAPAPVAGAPARGQGRRGRGGPPPVTRPVPTVDSDTLILSYYTPATVATKHRVEHAGKYQIGLDLIAHETYADNLFDLNKCQVIIAVNGDKLIDQEFVREGYGKKYEFQFERELPAGEHEFSVEIRPIGPETPQYRNLRLRVNSIAVRGPLAPEYWVKTPGYEKYFPRDVPTGAAERRAYAREVLQKFGTRAFRRPVDAGTLDGLVKLAENVYGRPTHSFEMGVAQAMVAVLASPTFIFREDRTVAAANTKQAYPLIDEYSLASRLSYFLWSSMPDDELLKLAAEGQLRKNLSSQVSRMLKDPKSQELVRNFTGQWLQARDIATVPINSAEVYLRDNPNPEYEKAREVSARLSAIPQGERTPEQTAALADTRRAIQAFMRQPKPELTDRLRQAMLQETELTFSHILREDRSVLELLKSDYTFLNEELAKFYGIEGVSGNEMRKVTLAPDSPRGGVLTQGTILAVTSNPTRTSPVKRGVFILEAILGIPPAPPPPNIPPLEDAASAEVLRSLNLRDTLALHAKNPTCNSCHSRMDPLGLALENFNAMGAYRTTDSAQPVLPAGKLITGESFSDVRELKTILVTSHRHDFYHSLAEKLLTYALGRGVEHYDVPVLDDLVAQLESSGGRPSVLLQALVNSVPFQQRRESASLADGTNSPTPSNRVSQNLP